jgi:two-component system CheB/CheR fusion protein
MSKSTDILGAATSHTKLHNKVANESVRATSAKTHRQPVKTKPILQNTHRGPGEAERLQNQKLETVGRLAAGIAHDFKNLLTIISGNLEMLALDRQEPRQQRKLIAEAWRTTDLMNRLTANLLAFMQQGEIDYVPTDVSHLTASAARLLARFLGNGVSLEVKIDEGLMATINAAQFQTILINLVLNARDAMPEGGCVTVRVKETLVDVEPAREMRLKAGRYIAVSVSDTGIGMPTEALCHAFEPFHTTKPAGVGLGLASVQQFAANVGGAARINSKLDRGTTVELLIPLRLQDMIERASLLPTN